MRKLLLASLLVFGCGGGDDLPCLTCDDSSSERKCGSGWYDPSTQFCSSAVYSKCGGTLVFAPTTEQCGGSSKYTLSTQRCGESNVIETACGSDWYNATNANLRCQSGVVETKCGTSSWYDASNASLRCQNSVVESSCGGDWYDASSMQLCSGGTLRSYKTVEIGGKVWFAENLNYNVSGSKCYGNKESNGTTYGRLYDWSTAMALPSSCSSTSCSSQIDAKHQGICPSGWHIPTQAEWNALSSYVQSNKGCTSCDAKHLKAVSGWYNNGNGLDTYGFSALPGGGGYSDGIFDYVGYVGDWWSSSEYYSGYAYTRGMNYFSEYAALSPAYFLFVACRIELCAIV